MSTPKQPATVLCPKCGNLVFPKDSPCEVCIQAKVDADSKGTYFRKELIKTVFLEKKQMWSAHVTWRRMDIQEYGETESTAIYFLLTKHADWFSKRSKE